MAFVELPLELWKEVLAECTPPELAHMCLVNSHFLEASRDALYHKVAIEANTGIAIIVALGHGHLARRLCHLFIHMTNLIKIFASGKDGRAALITFFEDLSFQVFGDYISSPPNTATAPLPSLFLFQTHPIADTLQTRALQDLDVTEPRLLSAMPIVLAASYGIRPTLDSFRIEYSGPFWIVLSRYVDLRSLTRLAIWNTQYDYVDIKPDRGDLVLLSAHTSNVLSIWLAKGLLRHGLLEYITSMSEFPVLHTLYLLSKEDTLKSTAPHWTTALLPIIKAFYERSPSLQHIGVYINGFAGEIRNLQNIQVVKLSSLGELPPASSKGEMVHAMTRIFYPVQLHLELGVHSDCAWPIFGNEDEVRWRSKE
ncbi:hypothetical protein DL96DRAFT_1817316 [Flagelloscypha sp. PMI_526]|nr:hypothetical protein DL96DRAFT_1817316 [Flagelloscypha sp. PMI_526]